MRRQPYLHDNDLTLSPFTGSPDELNYIRVLRNQPEVRRWLFDDQEISPQQQLRWYLQKYMDNEADLMWLLILDDKVRVGTAALYNITETCAEFGRLMIDPQFRGRKFAQRASALVRDYAFDVLNLEYIYGSAKADNTHILHVDKLTGFQVIKEEDGIVYMELHRDALP